MPCYVTSLPTGLTTDLSLNLVPLSGFYDIGSYTIQSRVYITKYGSTLGLLCYI